jgi:putative intracellular protease/amidase
MRLTIVLFDRFTTLDAVGGYESLARIPGMEVDFVAKRAGPVTADTGKLQLVASRALAEVERTDILYVPGGPGVDPLERDEAFLAKLRALDATSTWTIGICNGVCLLGAAGLLKGVHATTNYFSREHLATWGVHVVPERYHRDGKYVTGAGVSASIDTGLYVAQLLVGEVAAKAIGLGIEYFPSPPYAEKRPEDMPAPIAEIVRSYDRSSRR